MEVIEFYLFHGFLGLPEDWKEFENYLGDELKGKGIYCRVHRYNLWIDYEKNSFNSPHGGKDYFTVWAENKRREIGHLTQKKVFLGYSVGGRLLMHLPLTSQDNVMMVGYISAHPGLLDGQDRKERRMMDYLWSENFAEMPWEELMSDWNSQEVFANDKLRPHREETHYKRELLSRFFKDWSLANQEPRDSHLASKSIDQYWFYGEKDSKYKPLVSRLQKVMGKDRCVSIAGSGHGVLWDNPRALAEQVAILVEKKLASEKAD